jgi:hypothetical protein
MMLGSVRGLGRLTPVSDVAHVRLGRIGFFPDILSRPFL